MPSNLDLQNYYPKNLAIGDHIVDQTELQQTDKFQIKLEIRSENRNPYYLPSIETPLILSTSKFSIEEKLLEFTLNGQIEKESGEKIELKNFQIKLHNW